MICEHILFCIWYNEMSWNVSCRKNLILAYMVTFYKCEG